MEIKNEWKIYLIQLVKKDIEKGNYTFKEVDVRTTLIEDIQKTTKWLQD